MRVHPSRAGTGQEAADTLRQRREVRGRVDLVQPGFIEFDDDGLGSLGFIVVTENSTAATPIMMAGRALSSRVKAPTRATM